MTKCILDTRDLNVNNSINIHVILFNLRISAILLYMSCIISYISDERMIIQIL